jgi:hypothetical protein
MAMVPEERGRRSDGRPFALVGIDGDEVREKARTAAAETR